MKRKSEKFWSLDIFHQKEDEEFNHYMEEIILSHYMMNVIFFIKDEITEKDTKLY